MNHPPSVVKYEQPMTRRRTASSTDKSYNVGGGGDAAAAPDNAVIIAAHPHDKDSFPKLELKAAANPSFPALDVGAAIPNSSPMEKAAGAQENPKKLHWTQKRQQVKVACVHCRKACKKCDEARPCSRCVHYNFRCYDEQKPEKPVKSEKPEKASKKTKKQRVSSRNMPNQPTALAANYSNLDNINTTTLGHYPLLQQLPLIVGDYNDTIVSHNMSRKRFPSASSLHSLTAADEEALLDDEERSDLTSATSSSLMTMMTTKNHTDSFKRHHHHASSAPNTEGELPMSALMADGGGGDFPNTNSSLLSYPAESVELKLLSDVCGMLLSSNQTSTASSMSVAAADNAPFIDIATAAAVSATSKHANPNPTRVASVTREHLDFIDPAYRPAQY